MNKSAKREAQPAPWTQGVLVNWPRALRYYEEKLKLLRVLQDQGAMKAFRIEGESISARLRDNDHELECFPTGLSAHLFRPDGDAKRVSDAMLMAVEMIQPEAINRLVIRLQYLLQVDHDYDKARSLSGQVVAGSLVGDRGLEDFALLIDIESQIEDVKCQAEFGLVSQGEIPARLSRVVGKMKDDPLKHDWDESRFPEVALFIDAVWRWYGRADGKNATELITTVWDSARGEGNDLAGRVYAGLELSAGEVDDK